MSDPPKSPLQGGAKRRLGWDGPSLAGPRGTRGRLRRWVAVAASVLAALVGWLTLGSSDLGRPVTLGVIGLFQGDSDRARSNGSANASEARVPSEASITLSTAHPLPVELDERPQSALVFDLETGDAIWRRGPREVRPIASLTKIMSALLVSEQLRRPAQRVKIDDRSAGTEGSAIGLEPGMEVRRGVLFQMMMIPSANDAANALAVDTAGSRERFVAQMNRRARRLGLDCTRFVSAHGLEAENRSCAHDLAVLTRLAMADPRIQDVARRERAVVPAPFPEGSVELASTNPLLQTDYRGALGLKTGYTVEAGRCLVAVIERGGRKLAVVLLDSPNPAEQAQRLVKAVLEQTGTERSLRQAERGSGTASGPGGSGSDSRGGRPPRK